MKRAVLETRDALGAAGHQVCIVWRELSLRQDMPLQTYLNKVLCSVVTVGDVRHWYVGERNL